jgi:MFS family permease
VNPPQLASRNAFALIAMLAATTMLSQFYRTALAVIAPELIQDLGLSARQLGLANGGFYIALLLAQVAVGVSFDRIGVRTTVSVLSSLMVAGAALHAVADTPETFIAARFVTGLGCAASFMSAVVLVSGWFPRARWSTVLSWVFGSSQLGVFAAGAPLAYFTGLIGWRQTFLASAGLAALVGVLFYVLVRDPVQASSSAGKRQDNLGPFAGVAAVLRLPGVLPVFALFGVAYASAVTLTSLWAGTYLKDVYGLDAAARGNILSALSIAYLVMVLVIGPLDRVLNTRKWIALTCGTLCCAVLAFLAVNPAPPLAVAVAALLMVAGFTSYNTILLAHMRSHFPDHLAGRGATTGNMWQLGGTALLPMVTGLIPGVFPSAGPGYAVEAYRWIFATLALALGLGLAVYLSSKDVRPR